MKNLWIFVDKTEPSDFYLKKKNKLFYSINHDVAAATGKLIIS